MTCLLSDHRPLFVHPLEALDQSMAGYLLDLIRRFRHAFGWRFDHDSLHSLLFLAQRHVPELRIGPDGQGAHPSCASLIRRLQMAGDLAQDERGLALTPRGEARRRSTFRIPLAAPAWHAALERICEDLTIFAETEGVPLAAHDIVEADEGRVTAGSSR